MSQVAPTGQVAQLSIARELSVQVLVIGAGPAGVAAAIAAARRGCQTLLVERHGAAGGAMALGLNLTPVGFEPFKYWTTATDPAGWAVQGIARQLYDRMIDQRAVVKPVWDAETCKWQLDQMLTAAGVQVLFHASCVDAVMQGDRVTGAIVATRAGLWRVQAAVCIDCSGDGELFAKTGAAFEMGRPDDGRPQPMAMVAMVGGLNLPLRPDASMAEWMAHSKALVAPVLEAAWQSGRIAPTFAGILFPRVVRGGVLPGHAWARWLPQWADPTDPEAVAHAEIAARETLQHIVDILRAEVPGCENVAVLQTSAEVWSRGSRRLIGQEQLHHDDIAANRRQAGGIAHGCGFLEVHSATPGDPRPEKGFAWQSPASLIAAEVDYDISYGCLLPQSVDGLLVAGRCLSATHLAQSSARMQITCMATGEAAGAAAALAVRDCVAAAAVSVPLLRADLVAGGAKI